MSRDALQHKPERVLEKRKKERVIVENKKLTGMALIQALKDGSVALDEMKKLILGMSELVKTALERCQGSSSAEYRDQSGVGWSVSVRLRHADIQVIIGDHYHFAEHFGSKKTEQIYGLLPLLVEGVMKDFPEARAFLQNFIDIGQRFKR